MVSICRHKTRRIDGAKTHALLHVIFARLLFAVLSLTLPSIVYAQTPPDAGSLLNQIERGLPPPKIPTVGASETTPKIELLKGKGETLFLKQVSFEGNLAIKSEELAKIAAPFLSKKVYFADLQNLTAEIALFYRSRGLVATVSIPPQTVTQGKIKLRVVEARFSGALMDPASKGRIREDFIRNRFEKAVGPGQLVDIYQLDRALLLLNDLPGASISGGLASGEREGESRYIIFSQDTPLIRGNASVDNNGSHSTGSMRANADISLNSLFGVGDSFSLTGLHTEGSDYARFSTSLPLTENDLRMTFSGSRMTYALVASEFKAGNFTGASTTYGVEAAYPLLRSQSRNLYLTAAYDGREYQNESNSTVTSQYRSDSISIGFKGNIYDDIWGGGTNTFATTFSTGYLNLTGSPNQQSDSTGANTQNLFSKIKATFSRTQLLSENLSGVVSINAQYGFKNLDSSEKFFLGGASGIRAYPSSEGGGTSGILLTSELRQNLDFGLQAAVFHDIGTVQQYRNNDFSGAPSNNILSYQGIGASLLWRGPYNTSYKIVWAHRLNHNPNPNNSTGNDQDGTYRRNRIWMSASGEF